MRKIRRLASSLVGACYPLLGLTAPVFGVSLLAALTAGCSDQDHEESLPLVQVGMTKDVAPIYDDEELQIYEVKKGVAFPILAPNANARNELGREQMEPYGRRPWVTTEDVQVQVTWTISNLDEEPHIVEMLIDPWNEFGRYYPGLRLTDADNEEFMPNFSGIDKRYSVGGKGEGDASRVHGTYTFADLEEVATDLATVMALLEDPPVTEGDAEEEDPTVIYTNHAFHWQNHSSKDPLVAAWVPTTVAGLTGLDVGFRTFEPATVAIELAIELVDKHGERVQTEDTLKEPLLPPTEEIITVGVAP